MQTRSRFFELLAQVNEVENKHHDKSPDINAQILLMRVAMAHHAGKPLNVTQAMGLSHIGSPAMLHRKINDLLTLNMIELAFVGNNRRTKFITPTAQAYAVIDEMAQAAESVYDTLS